MSDWRHGTIKEKLCSASKGESQYRDELEHLVRSSTMLEVVHTLTRAQPPGWTGYHRRIDAELLRNVAWPSAQHPLMYICGPTPFVGPQRE